MALYIDTAKRDELTELWSSTAFAGVTTNPTILKRAGLTAADRKPLYDWLRDLGVERIYMQATGESTADLLAAADEILGFGPAIIKVPANLAGYACASELISNGVEVLMTAVYHPKQAIVSRDIGAHGIAPYVGRMDDAGRCGVNSVLEMQRIVDGSGTRILAASIRSVDMLTELIAGGVADITIGTEVARQLLVDNLTDAAVAAFEADAAT